MAVCKYITKTTGVRCVIWAKCLFNEINELQIEILFYNRNYLLHTDLRDFKGVFSVHIVYYQYCKSFESFEIKIWSTLQNINHWKTLYPMHRKTFSYFVNILDYPIEGRIWLKPYWSFLKICNMKRFRSHRKRYYQQ